MDVQQTLWWLSIAAEFAALVSLIFRRLATAYLGFVSYLALGVIRGIGLHFAGNPRGSRTYAISWLLTEPLLLILLILATIEIVGKIPSHYKGFGSFGKRRLRRLLDAAIVMALLSSVIDAWGLQWIWSIPFTIRFMFGLHRITTSILALYLLLVAIFVSRVRVPFRRNLPVHSRLFACYLCLQTGVMLWQNVLAGGRGTNASNDVLTGGSAVLFVLWVVLLSRKGEALPPQTALSPEMIEANQEREKALESAVRRYSDRRSE